MKTKAPVEPQMYPLAVAAQLMSMDRTGLYDLCAAGEIEWVDIKTKPTSRPRIRITQKAIDEFIKARTKAAKKRAA
jgi:hypothetical protein